MRRKELAQKQKIAAFFIFVSGLCLDSGNEGRSTQWSEVLSARYDYLQSCVTQFEFGSANRSSKRWRVISFRT